MQRGQREGPCEGQSACNSSACEWSVRGGEEEEVCLREGVECFQGLPFPPLLHAMEDMDHLANAARLLLQLGSQPQTAGSHTLETKEKQDAA